MLPVNIDVVNGKANGTQAVVEKVVLHNGVSPRPVKLNDRITVQGVTAGEVKHVVLRHINDRITIPLFEVGTKEYAFKAQVLNPTAITTKCYARESLDMKATQVALLVNNATTGHKLQGSGVTTLFVHSWSYVANWVYVMLSRVKTLDGLYLRMPLDTNLRRYKMCAELSQLLERFRSTCSPSLWQAEDYDEMFGDASI